MQRIENNISRPLGESDILKIGLRIISRGVKKGIGIK